MREPEKEFIGKGEAKGFKFKLLNANPRTFLYEVDIGHSKHYEVFLRKIHSQYGHIMYPRSKSFGVWAWSFYNLDRATAKFNQL